MSQTYTDLPYTAYPDGIDVFTNKSDANSMNRRYIVEYKNLFNDGDIAGAAALLEQFPELKEIIITAADFNKLQNAIEAMQRFVKRDKQQIIFSTSEPSGEDLQFIGDVWVKLVPTGANEVYELTESGYVYRDLGSQAAIAKAEEAIKASEDAVSEVKSLLGDQVTYTLKGTVLTITTK